MIQIYDDQFSKNPINVLWKCKKGNKELGVRWVEKNCTGIGPKLKGCRGILYKAGHSRQMEQQKDMTAVHSSFKKPVDQYVQNKYEIVNASILM